MNHRIPACLLAVVLGGLAPAFSADQDEEHVTLDQLPAAVKATLLKEANGAILSDLEKETKNGKVIYSAELPGARKSEVIEITVAGDGTLLGKETETEEKDHEGHEHQH